MTIEQLKSGSYRIRQTYKGHRYSVTVPYKPNKREATMLIAQAMEAEQVQTYADDGNVAYYVEKYLRKCEKEDLSPATIRGYNNLYKSTPAWFLQLPFYEVTNSQVQKLIDDYKVKHSPKSTRNLLGLYRPIFRAYRKQFVIDVELPALIKKMEYEPTTDDITRILKYAEDSRYSILLQLCVLGLRRGEAMAITAMDIDRENVLTISKDIVVDKNNKVLVKDHPKTSASYRRIPLDAALANQIKAQGYAYKGSPHAINKYLSKTQKELGIPHFRLHMTRHFCAAHLHKQKFSDEEVMAWLGWDDPSTMMKIYRYNLDPAENMAEMKNSFSKIITSVG